MTEQVENVKLNRTDVARLVAMQVQVQVERGVVEAVSAVADARTSFERAVVEECEATYQALLAPLSHEYGSLVSKVSYECTVDDPGVASAQVTWSDSERTYDGRCFVTLNVALTPGLLERRDTWHSALRLERIARDRDSRMSACSKEARDEIIKSALAGEHGPALLAAAKKVAAQVVVDASKLKKDEG